MPLGIYTTCFEYAARGCCLEEARCCGSRPFTPTLYQLGRVELINIPELTAPVNVPDSEMRLST